MPRINETQKEISEKEKGEEDVSASDSGTVLES